MFGSFSPPECGDVGGPRVTLLTRVGRSWPAAARRGRVGARLIYPRYSHEYPVGEGRDYVLKSVPTAVWEKAKQRAHAQHRSVRVVLIRALQLFADGRLEV